jgi:hypothetical protein
MCVAKIGVFLSLCKGVLLVPEMILHICLHCVGNDKYAVWGITLPSAPVERQHESQHRCSLEICMEF